MLTQFILLLLSTTNIILPTVGNIYKKTIQFPLLGNQNIETKFMQNNMIIIKLSGLLDSKGSAQYSLIDNTLNIELSDNLKILMKNKKTEFKLINYDDEKDIVNIYLHIKPLFYKKNIELERIN
jgi:hypothetical protein